MGSVIFISNIVQTFFYSLTIWWPFRAHRSALKSSKSQLSL